MNLIHRPPTNEPVECEMLETNYISCLREKAIKDRVEQRQCNLERVLWYYLECPDYVTQLRQPENFKRAFVETQK